MPNQRCGMGPGLTIRAKERVPDGSIAALTAAVAAARASLAAADIPTPPLVVTVWHDDLYLTWRGDELQVPARALAQPDDTLARAIATYGTTRDLPGHLRASAAAAMVRAHFPSTPTPHLDAAAFEIAPWARAAKKCPDGWPGLLDQRCATP